MDDLDFFKSLEAKDWSKKINKTWTVKDALAHLVGWEREVAVSLRDMFFDEKEPWFLKVDDYTDFNNKIYNEFKNDSSSKLLSELEKWRKVAEQEIQNIGEYKIRSSEHSNWVFDDGDGTHFGHHIDQIKTKLGR